MRASSVWLLLIAAATLTVVAPCALAAEPDFNRQVRPILSANCFKCHGPDAAAREAELRLDQPGGPTSPAASGQPAIDAGNLAASQLLARIDSSDPDMQMPPPAANKTLSAEQKEILRAWVLAGARYEPHWAFVPPQKAALPTVAQPDWPRNAIDRFVLARIEAAGLRPSPPADDYALIRRLSLDLIGLPPTPAEIDQFVSDDAPDAYERLIDRLLASPHYGERWARRWLDLARYADTNGYEKDRARSIWPYRDWVIAALNADMPYDQFTIEQLAGDLLPNATPAQRIATGFHRNTMLNEEGGVDPLEFRFHAMVDRVGTTGTVWMGLTIGCAQCHTHKFDPIPHVDFYRMMALLNNADEPQYDVPDATIAERRAVIEQQIAALDAALPSRFPPEDPTEWRTPPVTIASSAEGATLTAAADGAITVSGNSAERDVYTLELDAGTDKVEYVELQALADPALPSSGPGRTPHGNFVITDVAANVQPAGEGAAAIVPVFAAANADFAQAGFDPSHVLDHKSDTGWAIQGPSPWNVDRWLRLSLAEPIVGGRWQLRIEQQYGGSHTLGKFRVRFGQTRLANGQTFEASQRQHFERRFAEWLSQQRATAVVWRPLLPSTATSNLPQLKILEDRSIIAGGDQSKRDVYRVAVATDLERLTAVRLEVIPDDRFPNGGPGRIAYEGPFGDFFLSEFKLRRDEEVIPWRGATHSFAAGGNTSERAIDGDPQTGWSIDGGQGRAHTAVFALKQPLTTADGLELELLFERYYAAGLGRFRLWGTDAPELAPASALPTELEAIIRKPDDAHSPDERQTLERYFASVAPELAAAREEITKLRANEPKLPTTLVMAERPADNPRATHLHERGEFLRPAEPVTAEVPSLFAPLPVEQAHDRLALARWLVSPQNPLAARVAVNRAWAAIFGRGIVRTTEDFGYQGDPPTHPELLDWLAVELIEKGWSMKELHRQIVTSATYRQSSAAPAELLATDPQNKLLTHMPRVRLDAELVRDALLRISGLLTERLGGPSVFPPQPVGVTSEGTYGPLSWQTSEGPDRYRRGLYTFAKRTAPYAMFSTFDGPTGEACVARREVSNTPLQALTMLNDVVFIEVAQSLGNQLATASGSVDERVGQLFYRATGRPAGDAERTALAEFFGRQLARLEAGELDAAKIGGEGATAQRAAWTLTARAVLNLDQVITKD